MNFKRKILDLSETYASTLKSKINERVNDMLEDDKSHYLIYKVPDLTTKKGEMIDIYQNKGRFLYKYAGSFLEESAILCFEERFNNAQRKIRIPNTQGSRPKTFEIDCLVEPEAYEIEWRDATTDGDHIIKEHTSVKNIKEAGYLPIRIMFYYPNRTQAIKIQETLKTIYAGVDGEYYYGNSAWEYIQEKTDIDLKEILMDIAFQKTGETDV